MNSVSYFHDDRYIALKMKSVSRFYYLIIVACCLFQHQANSQEFQSFDGANNSKFDPVAGSNGATLLRVTDVAYSDGISEMAGTNRMNPRQISNIIFAQSQSIADDKNLSDYTWVFGQFVDHDITLVENSIEDISINVGPGDQFFAENSKIHMSRSIAAEGTGTSIDNPREHTNLVTAFIDGSAIYGSDDDRANWLRSFEDGKLKVSKENLLPWNTESFEFNSKKSEDAPFMADDTRSGTKLFVAGDIRANENPLLLTFHTIFVREHNRLCDELKIEDPSLSDEQLYQMARRHVSAYLQNIVFNEWLPSMGVHLPVYSGYKEQMQAGIFNVFSSSAFRLGHTLINSNVIRMSDEGEEIPRGNISLRDAFFNPGAILLAGGIDPYFQGMATQVQQALDCRIIDDVRNFLFGPPGTGGGLDLAAININRGRERGIADYNTVRSNFGLPRVNTFLDITKDQEEADMLQAVYGSVDNIDSWVGLLAEYHMPDALFGETIMMIMMRQFQILRDADRFYFENDPIFSEKQKEELRNTNFRDIIMRNTNIKIMQENVFEAMPFSEIPTGPEIPEIQLSAEIYPNPTADVFTLKIFSENDTTMKVTFFDNSGRIVIQEVQELYQGNNFISYDIAQSLSNGFYNIVLEQGLSYKVLKLVKED